MADIADIEQFLFARRRLYLIEKLFIREGRGSLIGKVFPVREMVCYGRFPARDRLLLKKREGFHFRKVFPDRKWTFSVRRKFLCQEITISSNMHKSC